MEPNQQSPINSSAPSNMPGQAGAPMGHDHNGQKKVGPIVATLVIVLILIMAALYLFASRINQQAIPMDTTTTVDNSAPTQTPVPTITSTASDPASLQRDLNASTQGLDSQNF